MILSKGGFVRPFQKEEFCPQPLPEMFRMTPGNLLFNNTRKDLKQPLFIANMRRI